MKMYPDNWRVRRTSAALTAVCIVAAALLGLGPEAGLWPFVLSILVAVIVGNVLGGPVYRLLSRPSSNRRPDDPPHA